MVQKMKSINMYDTMNMYRIKYKYISFSFPSLFSWLHSVYSVVYPTFLSLKIPQFDFSIFN